MDICKQTQAWEVGSPPKVPLSCPLTGKIPSRTFGRKARQRPANQAWPCFLGSQGTDFFFPSPDFFFFPLGPQANTPTLRVLLSCLPWAGWDSPSDPLKQRRKITE